MAAFSLIVAEDTPCSLADCITFEQHNGRHIETISTHVYPLSNQ